jgi:hypothetical protein
MLDCTARYSAIAFIAREIILTASCMPNAIARGAYWYAEGPDREEAPK